jgi:hypothetical protein
MNEDIVVLKRDELYKLVWSEPMQRLSKKYGLSDVGLAKICRKMEIPRPGRGYWMKKKSGRPMLITPLPIARGITIRQIRIQKREKEVKQESQIEEPEIIKSERLPENRITVAQRLYRPDPLIERTERALKKAEPDDYGRIRPFGEGSLDVRVSRENAHRALLIMDALIKALKERGYLIVVTRWKTQISVLEEKIDIRLVESTKQSERILSKEELKKKESDPFFRLPRFTYSPTGNLSLMVNDYYPRPICSDGKKQRLEDLLNKCIIGLIKIALKEKANRLERERREREREEERRRYEEEQRIRKEEEARFNVLLNDATNWNKSQQLRAYIEEIKRVAKDKYWEFEPRTKLEKWVDWATQKANLLDPIGSGRTWRQVLELSESTIGYPDRHMP